MFTIKVYIVLCSVFLRAKLNLTVPGYFFFHVVCIPIKPGDCNIWKFPWIKFPVHQSWINSLLFTEEGWVTTIQYITILQTNIIQHTTVSSPIVGILNVMEWWLHVRMHFKFNTFRSLRHSGKYLCQLLQHLKNLHFSDV